MSSVPQARAAVPAPRALWRPTQGWKTAKEDQRRLVYTRPGAIHVQASFELCGSGDCMGSAVDGVILVSSVWREAIEPADVRVGYGLA